MNTCANMVQMLPKLLHHNSQLLIFMAIIQFTNPMTPLQNECLEYILLFRSPFCVWSLCFYFHVWYDFVYSTVFGCVICFYILL